MSSDENTKADPEDVPVHINGEPVTRAALAAMNKDPLLDAAVDLLEEVRSMREGADFDPFDMLRVYMTAGGPLEVTGARRQVISAVDQIRIQLDELLGVIERNARQSSVDAAELQVRPVVVMREVARIFNDAMGEALHPPLRKE